MDELDIKVTYIRPCVTDAGKVSAETRLVSRGRTSSELLSDFFDSARLCWLLSISRIFSKVKCSEKLGIAKMEFEGKTIVVSKGGRINIRTAEDKEDALRTVWLVSKALWPSIICPKCQKSVLECVSGLCVKCEVKNCGLLLRGPPNPNRESADKPSSRTVNEILTEAQANASVDFNEARRNLDEVCRILRKMVTSPNSGTTPENIQSVVSEHLRCGNELAQNLLIQSPRQMGASAGLILLGISANLEMLSVTLASLAKTSLSNEYPAIKLTWDAFLAAYEDLWKPAYGKREKSRSHVRRSLMRVSERKNEVDFRIQLEKIVEAGNRLRSIRMLALAV